LIFIKINGFFVQNSEESLKWLKWVDPVNIFSFFANAVRRDEGNAPAVPPQDDPAIVATAQGPKILGNIHFKVVNAHDQKFFGHDSFPFIRYE